MKAKSVLIPDVLLAVVALSGCLAKTGTDTGTGTSTSYISRAATAPAAGVGIKSADRAAGRGSKQVRSSAAPGMGRGLRTLASPAIVSNRGRL